MSFGEKAFLYDSGKVLINPAVKELQQDQLNQLVSIEQVLNDILAGQPSGTQDVNIVGSTEIEVTLNGEPVELWRGGSQADALFVQWSGSQQVTVQGSVQVVTQGNNRLSVDAAQDGAWSVSIDNFPSEYPLPAAQVSALTPQTDALTDVELRAAPIAVENLAQLVPEQYDEIALSYTGGDLTGVVYKAATVTVATLTLGYTSGKLTSVVRS